MALKNIPVFGIVLLVGFMSTDFLSLYFPGSRVAEKKVTEEANAKSEATNQKEFQFESSETDDYYDEFNPGTLGDDDPNNDDKTFDEDGFDRGTSSTSDTSGTSGTPKVKHNNDLSKVPDDNSMDGILTEEEQKVEEKIVEEKIVKEKIVEVTKKRVAEEEPTKTVHQKIKAKQNFKKERDILDILTNPSTLFEDPPYDVTKLSRGGRVHISFCTSWSYKGGFHQLRNYITERYGDIKVIGTNYPISTTKLMMSRGVIGLILTGILVSLLGETFCKWFGIVNPPEFMTKMMQNKLTTCMFIWFVGNLVNSGLTSTGAFEISYNGSMVFSKLETGRMPMVDEVMDAIDQLRGQK